MPRVLFHYPVFNTGGAEMSVLRLTRFLAENGWDVELVLTTGGGTMEDRIDPRVKVHRLRDFAAGSRFASAKGLAKFVWAVADGIPYAWTRLQESSRSKRFAGQKYDAAIVSLQGLSAEFCCTKVNARRRIQWIRNDLAECDPDGKADRNIRKWKDCIDFYACVAGTSKESFDRIFPDMAGKSRLVYNVIDADQMRRSAEDAPDPYISFGPGLRVVTVCRLADKAKGLFRMLRIHKRLVAEGFSHKWFLVGDGPDKEAVEEAVVREGLSESFFLLGRQSNPFPYYKFADVSATLSYYEGLCGTVNEAKIMGKPVIATEFSGIHEQIVSGVGGLIVANEEEAIYAGMKRILSDESLREKLSNTALAKEIADDQWKLQLLTELVMGDSR